MLSVYSILMKALDDDLIDIKTFRFYSRLIHLGEQALIYQGKETVEISKKTIGENYVSHVGKKMGNRRFLRFSNELKTSSIFLDTIPNYSCTWNR